MRMHMSMLRVFACPLLPLLAASASAWSPIRSPSADAPPGYCTEGYGLFCCADPINCTAIVGKVSCCENSKEVVESKLNKGRCGSRLEERGRTCLTSIACSPFSATYFATLPVSKFHPSNTDFVAAAHAATWLNSTMREPQTQTVALRTSTPTPTSYATTYTASSTSIMVASALFVATTYTTASSSSILATSVSFVTAVSLSTLTTAVATISPQPSTTEVPSLSFSEVPGHKPMEGNTIGGTVVCIIAGGSLLILALYLLFRRWKTRRDNRNPRNRGVLPGPRLPTGSAVATPIYRRDQSDGWHTLPKSSESSHPTGDLEANVEQPDIGLQYYPEPAQSQTDGPVILKKTAAERSSVIADGNVTPSGSPVRQSYDPTSPPWSAENDSSTLHSRRSNVTIHWPLPKSTVSSPALLMNTREPPAISPLSPLSPFGDFDTVKAEVEQHIEKEHHQQDAYKKLSGEVSDVALAKKPGSVSRARQNMTAAPEAPKKPGSVAHARQNIEAARGAIEQPRRETEARQNMGGLRDYVRELDAQRGDEDTNETGTVIRRRSKRA